MMVPLSHLGAVNSPTVKGSFPFTLLFRPYSLHLSSFKLFQGILHPLINRLYAPAYFLTTALCRIDKKCAEMAYRVVYLW